MLRSLLIALGLTLCSSFALAQDAAPRDWGATTRQDIEAAYALLNDNHPGALPVFGDPGFRERLEGGRSRALQQAQRVDSIGGHRAVMNAFAMTMGDAHIQFRPRANAPWRWSGLLFRRESDTWRLSYQLQGEGEPGLVDARLVDCDGVPAEDVGRNWLDGYKADWTVKAQQRLKGLYLFLNDDNPFLREPERCRLRRPDGTEVEHVMRWRAATPDELQTAVDSVITYKSAGMGVRTFAGGGWIALGSLGDGAPAVVEAVRTRAEELRGYPVLVLDMRGNGGGASGLGMEIANALMGPSYVASRVGRDGLCGMVWRATPGNLEGVRGWRRQDRGPEFLQWVDQTTADLESALAEGRETDKPVPVCPAIASDQAAGRDAGAASLFPGRLVLITDEVCFSSCLLVADAFRKLGAMHLGHETQRATRYTEVRAAPLPSGLGSFTTMQRAMIGGDIFVGPYTPEIEYPGPMVDDAALEAWVVETLKER